jgi:Prohead core protein serine protease
MTKKLLIERSFLVHPVSASGVVAESSQFAKGYKVESSGSDGLMRVILPATELEKQNENGRTYSKNLMEKVCVLSEGSFKKRELLSSVNEHPTESAYVTPGQASHMVTKAWVEGNYLMNEWTIMNTSTGKDLKALIEAGAAFGVSIRGLGSEDKDGNILEDYEYLGTDCVGQPSAKIRTAPEVMKEAADQPSLNHQPVSKPTAIQESSKMKTLDQTLHHVREQIVLMKNESRLDAAKRLITLEGALAESTLPSKDMVGVYNLISEAKGSLFPESDALPATVVTEKTKVDSPADTGKPVQKQEAAVDPALVEFAKQAQSHIRTLATKLQEANLALAAAKKEKAKLEVSSNILRSNADRSAKKLAKVEKTLKLAASKLVMARNVAVESSAKYEVLLKISAKSLVESKSAKLKLAEKNQLDSSPLNSNTVRTESKVTNKYGDRLRNVTPANASGSVSIPGMI